MTAKRAILDFNGDLLTRCGKTYLREISLTTGAEGSLNCPWGHFFYGLSAKQPGDPVFKEGGWADYDGKPSMTLWQMNYELHVCLFHYSIGFFLPVTIVMLPDVLVTNLIPANIFGTLRGLSPFFWSQKTRTLSLTRDPTESQFRNVNTDSVDYITAGIR